MELNILIFKIFNIYYLFMYLTYNEFLLDFKFLKYFNYCDTVLVKLCIHIKIKYVEI